MSDKIQIVCSHCGSASVTRDATVRYDTETQEWSVSGIFDNADCDICGGETRLEEMPLDEWQKNLTATQDMHSPHLGIEVEIGIEHVGEEDDDKWVAIVSESDVGQIYRGTVIYAYPEEAKDAARQWATHGREGY